MGLEALVEELGVRERVPSVGVDRAGRRLTGGQMVWMARVHALPPPLRRGCEHDLGTKGADCSRDVAPQRLADLEAPVGVAEEADGAHAQLFGRGALLVTAEVRHLAAGNGQILAARLAVRHDAVRDLDARVGPHRDGPCGAEIDVVRMGSDDEDPFEVRARRPPLDQMTASS